LTSCKPVGFSRRTLLHGVGKQVSKPVHSVIQKDGLNFVSLYFKIRTSDKYDVNYI